MLIKLICASVICVKIKRFPLFLFFQSIKQSRAYPFGFAIGVCGKKDDLTIRRMRLQIMR